MAVYDGPLYERVDEGPLLTETGTGKRAIWGQPYEKRAETQSWRTVEARASRHAWGARERGWKPL